jgi:hypothetical protein
MALTGRFHIMLAVLMAAAPGASFALEGAAAPSGIGANRPIVVKVETDRSKQLNDIAKMQAVVEKMKTCMAKGKFYAPDSAGADAAGCSAKQFGQ